MTNKTDKRQRFASRGGDKLDAALAAFDLDVSGWICADFGANVGGFTDCLLQRGAAQVYAIDTGYGTLAWVLRKDPRVVVMERTNALHAEPPDPVDLVVIDMAWTPQHLSVPAAARWLRPGGRIVSLLKPHYELAKRGGGKPTGPLAGAESEDIRDRVCAQLTEQRFGVVNQVRSPIVGKGGNTEFLLLLVPPGD